MTHLAPSMKVSFMDVADDDLCYYSDMNQEYCEDGEVEYFDDSEAFEYVTQLPTRRAHLVTLGIYCCMYLVAILTVLSFGSLSLDANVMTQKSTLCQDKCPLLGFDETSSSTQTSNVFQVHSVETAVDVPSFLEISTLTNDSSTVDSPP